MEYLITWLYVIVKNAGFVSERFLKNLIFLFHSYMTKPTQWVCFQRRLRSAWASAQSDQSLHCPHEETLDPYLPNERTAKTLIRLGGCLGWSESSLGAYSMCWFCHVVAHIIIIFAWFIARQSHYIYFLGSRKKSKLKTPREDSDQTGHPPRLVSPRYALCRLLRTQAFFMRTVKTLD